MRRAFLLTPLLAFLYLYQLAGVGLLGPDEPRYAAIGREMARSGDWITPRLWSEPWFEKPALLYWMIALGHSIGLSGEWAARLPVALLSIAFLAFFYWILDRRFARPIALCATAILATSAGWLAYGFAALTDLPMTACLMAALLLVLLEDRREIPAGALLGLAVLAKGLVPLVLFAPALWLVRKRWWMLLAPCLLVAAPWYALCFARNGNAFLDEFFWRHHFDRFTSGSLLHVQPLWFYLPVLLAGLFPWTPLLALLARRFTDTRLRFLAGWSLFALIFFSLAQNKLPGYVLQVLPALAVLMAAALAEAETARWWLGACPLLLVAVPTIAQALPQALLVGITNTRPAFVLGPGLPFVGIAALVWWLEPQGRRTAAVLATSLCVAAGVIYMKTTTFPALDRTVSARAFWRSIEPLAGERCLDDSLRRSWAYGLNYYAVNPLPWCRQSAPILPIRNTDMLVWK